MAEPTRSTAASVAAFIASVKDRPLRDDRAALVEIMTTSIAHLERRATT